METQRPPDKKIPPEAALALEKFNRENPHVIIQIWETHRVVEGTSCEVVVVVYRDPNTRGIKTCHRNNWDEALELLEGIMRTYRDSDYHNSIIHF